MVSDSLLAINRFAVPLPMAQFFVLATYYVAQLLIAAQARVAKAKNADPQNDLHAPCLSG